MTPVPKHEYSLKDGVLSEGSRLLKLFLVLALMLAGVMQTFSLAPFNHWYLGPLSVTLILAVTRALNAPSSKFKGFFYGWVFGLGLFGSGASWVYVSIHTYGYAPPFLAGSLTLIFVMGLALFSGLTFYLYGKLKTASKFWNGSLFVACWVLGDLLRTFLFTGFPWLFLGYGHLQTPLAGWAPVLGVYALTAFSVASGVALYFVLNLAFKSLPVLIKPHKTAKKRAFRSHYHPKKTLLKLVFISVVCVIWLLGADMKSTPWTQSNATVLKVSLLQTNIPQEEKWKPSQRLKTLELLETMTAEHWDSDIVVWPETAIPLLYDQALPFIDKMSEAAKQHQTTLISGLPFRKIGADGRQILHNSIASFGMGDGVYHKQKLVPFGEYVPLQDLLRGLIAFFDLPMSDFRTGEPEQPLLKALSFKLAPYICYEVVYADFAARLARDSDFLLTISNDSWFGESIGPLQHLEMAQMRAAETRRFMLRGTNNGISAVIDPYGKLIAQSKQFVRTSLNAEIQTVSGSTPFMRYGSWPIALFSGFIVLIALAHRRLYGKH